MVKASLSLQNIENEITLSKTKGGRDVTFVGAFAGNDKIDISITFSKTLGAVPYLVIYNDDNGKETCIAFVLKNELGEKYEYCAQMNFKKLCPDGSGLLYWKIKLVCGDKVFYTQTDNNADFYITQDFYTGSFRTLVYDKSFCTPDWAKGGVVYQIFVDRFNKGSKKVPVRDDCVIVDDWYTGIPEFAEKQGQPLKNNTFFGGTLWGVIEKLDYLCDLGVNILYFCPIFKAYSNHKYDTGDYETVDKMFGGDKAFRELLVQAKKRNMKVILDGVFNHTGDDSKYFNRYGKYKNVGAYQSQGSKYYEWFNFTNFPEEYESWWGIDIMPRIQGANEKVREYFLGEKGIIRRWLREGIDGWRLDVADELDEGFLDMLSAAAKSEKRDSLIVGEVWENAADKISYDKRRKYFRGKELDSVMNYPIKTAIIDFVKYGDADKFYNAVTEIYSSYPDFCSNVLFNLIGSHDTDRILTVLGGESDEGKTNRQLSTMKMAKNEYDEAVRRLKIASLLQFTLPGIPMIYYGDEAGMQGYHDPFNRRPYPWGRENEQLLAYYKKLCSIKRQEKSLCSLPLEFLLHEHGLCVFKRGDVIVLVNTWYEEQSFALEGEFTNLLTGEAEKDSVFLEPMSAKIIK